MSQKKYNFKYVFTAPKRTCYLPARDRGALGQRKKSAFEFQGRGSFCEWKGPALYWDLMDGERALPQVAWRYPHCLAGEELQADWIAFYAHNRNCTVDVTQVVDHSGRLYGGCTTPDLSGPLKGTQLTPAAGGGHFKPWSCAMRA